MNILNRPNLTKNAIKRAIANRFSKASITYEQTSVLQQEVGNRLLDRLNLIKLHPNTILDLGSGIGTIAYQLNQHSPKAHIIQVDIAEGMLTHAKKSSESAQLGMYSYICADGENLPVASNTLDLVFSNCTFHWCLDPEQLLQEVYRVLKPDGLFLFSTVGPDTLKELRSCFSKIDSFKHINYFMDMHDIGDKMLKVGFQDPVVDLEILTVFHKNVFSLLKDLKFSGTNYIINSQSQLKSMGLTPKHFLNTLSKEYEHYRNGQNGLLPTTYEVIYGYALKGELGELGELDTSEFPIHFKKRY